MTGKPTVRDGTVYFGNRAGSATAVDLETGELVWQTSDSLLALHYDTGELEWHRQFIAGDVWTYFSPPPRGPDADVGATPTLFSVGDRDMVGVGDQAGAFDVFDRDTVETVWAKELTLGSPLGGVMATAAYAEPAVGGDGPSGEHGAIFVASNDMNPAEVATSNSTNHHTSRFALDAATGDTIWEKRLVGTTFGSITYADGVVYRPSVPGVLQAFDAENGRELWSAEPGGAMGAGVRIEDGWVLVPHGFGFFGGQSDLPGGVVAYRLPD